ncbi:MAG TPA: hypothetical protein VH092_20250 [Urbifossiella sp.]|jgi:hypothetical protein|nr:hypothetical protein [Urbifossiella sp.]
MNTALSPGELLKDCDASDFVRYELGFVPDRTSTQAGFVREKKTLVKRFGVYREASGTEGEPIRVRGFLYAASGKRVTSPQDPAELVERAAKVASEAPDTRCLLERVARYRRRRGTAINAIEFRTQGVALKTMVDLIRRVAANPNKWEERLDGFSTLKKGWDSYKAEPPAHETIDAAKGFLSFLLESGREPSKLNPSVVGGVGFTFRRGSVSVYIEFRNTGNVHAMFTDRAGKLRVVKVRRDRAGYEDILAQVETHLHEQPAAARGDGQ